MEYKLINGTATKESQMTADLLTEVVSASTSQNNEDKTRSPFWSNSSPNKFSEIFCKQNNADNAACYERVLEKINTALAASAPVPRAPIYTAQITINQQVHIHNLRLRIKHQTVLRVRQYV